MTIMATRRHMQEHIIKPVYTFRKHEKSCWFINVLPFRLLVVKRLAGFLIYYTGSCYHFIIDYAFYKLNSVIIKKDIDIV